MNMGVFLLYARRVLRRPFTLLIAVVMPLLMVQGVILQYENATAFSVGLSIPDPALHQFVVSELDRASVAHTDIPVSGRSGVAGVLVAIDGTTSQIAASPGTMKAAVSYTPRNATNVLLATRMNGIVSTVAYLARNASAATTLDAAMTRFEAAQAPISSATTVIGNTNNTVLVASFNMIVFVVLLLTMSTILMFLRDKGSTTTQRILVAARGKMSYYLQLVLLFAIIAVAEFAIMLAAMVWLFDVPLGLSWDRVLILVLAFTLFNVFAITLGLLLVSRTTQESTGRLLVTTVTLPMAMLGGALWPLAIMPSWMQTMAMVLPTTWLTELNGVLFSGFTPSTWSMVRPLLLLTGVVAALFAALSRVPSEEM
jgi:ABC-type multidrug transport system permease subunit